MQRRIIKLALNRISKTISYEILCVRDFMLILNKNFFSKLLEARDQGCCWKFLGSLHIATKAKYSFYTKFYDLRFIHGARLYLTALRGAITWCRKENSTCARCQLTQDTLNPVINNRPVNRKPVINRHDQAWNLIKSSIPAHYTIIKE